MKTQYTCQACGHVSPKWSGQCGNCEQWNTLTQTVIASSALSNPKGYGAKQAARQLGYASATLDEVVELANVSLETQPRIQTGISELDRVLGGGVVFGSVSLIGGDPGIGKSTLLLQMVAELSAQNNQDNAEKNVLYVTGEESLQQVTLRAKRLGLEKAAIQLFAHTQVETIIATAQKYQPAFLVVDSIQTLYTDALPSAPGSVAQVRESAALLVRFAKETGTALFLVGHVTKEGLLAGPRVLEHMVDTVLYFEGQTDNRYRVVRAVKNRFGAVNELGVFAMTDTGLKGVTNPSRLFLSQSQEAAIGSVVTATWEGSRPILLELQALVDESHLGNPRRVTVGLEANRLALVLAVLHRHVGVMTYNQDIFLNIVGGMRITETAMDLPVAMAVISSLKNKPMSRDKIIFGEIGLSGEVRPVQGGQERLQEAAKQGFVTAYVPEKNKPTKEIKGLTVHTIRHINDCLPILD